MHLGKCIISMHDVFNFLNKIFTWSLIYEIYYKILIIIENLNKFPLLIENKYFGF